MSTCSLRSTGYRNLKQREEDSYKKIQIACVNLPLPMEQSICKTQDWCSRIPFEFDQACRELWRRPPPCCIDRRVSALSHLDGVDAPRRHRCAKVVVLSNHQGRRPWARLARFRAVASLTGDGAYDRNDV